MKNIMFKIVPLTFLLLISATFISGCNTMSGIGKDIESAGDAIEGSAEKHKSY
jgi:predicted small secreted protein